jgi:hypothetical protein
MRNYRLSSPIWNIRATVGPLSIYAYEDGHRCTGSTAEDLYIRYIIAPHRQDWWQPHVHQNFNPVSFAQNYGFDFSNVERWLSFEGCSEGSEKFSIVHREIGSGTHFTEVNTVRGNLDQDDAILLKIVNVLRKNILS